ncbi:MAG TPA: glycosyltransferase family A protein [Dissulfurispiraceae bacterium]|nr:glycosyltransferase family A protein [Dissulfurispiraceae bacterium]
MSDKPLVSVVIPTYNRADLLPAAVQSVLDQTYPNVEVIVVDDGSTDTTRTVMACFLDRIRYIVTDNEGPAHARNTGMKAATGKYIAFLDSDDLYLPCKLELEVCFAEQHPDVGVVCTEVSGMNDSGIFEEYHLRSYHQIYNRLNLTYDDVFPEKGEFQYSAEKRTVPYYIGDVFRYVLRGPVLMSNTILFRREFLQHVGLQNESYPNAQEYEFVVRLCKNYRVGFIDFPTYLYRYHGTQISAVNQQWNKKSALTWIRIEKVFLQAVLDWGIADEKYYENNRSWLNTRVAELYHCIGEKWLAYGDMKAARTCFRQGLDYDPDWQSNRHYLYLSYIPSPIRRITLGIHYRLAGIVNT